ncbi:uncharacterized protein MELLADRAFT_110705 [Melampsora larici-populina 98AG31]|uniref:Uncharacterized protein n=1 Tax=Melampsora larici-populina (strain 98AG31 / pathotype 3-4-7) TaxID=747676 RepID=F4S0P1_MELLP|nr:uncharacterized protein MELLADRAFT_110705 [Melampsora larici-populina 98AG31]EGG01831.1 hypothetical protein MELLADRAFT_110705 [Melampsora larici-populina 98AG31]
MSAEHSLVVLRNRKITNAILPVALSIACTSWRNTLQGLFLVAVASFINSVTVNLHLDPFRTRELNPNLLLPFRQESSDDQCQDFLVAAMMVEYKIVILHSLQRFLGTFQFLESRSEDSRKAKETDKMLSDTEEFKFKA